MYYLLLTYPLGSEVKDLNIRKGFTVAALIAMGLLFIYTLKNNAELKGWLEGFAQGDRIVAAGINLQLGLGEDKGKEPEASPSQEPEETGGVSESFPPFPAEVEIPAMEEPPQESESPVVMPTTIEGGMAVRNDTELLVDLQGLLLAGPSQSLPAKGIQILIIHTHGSEAYTPDSLNSYTPSDNYRTEDRAFSVVRVGDELAACLESYGLNVLHDREIYDYPSYTGSYGRSAAAIEAHLTEHPEIAIVLDVHRDAIGSGDVVYKTVAESGGQPCSQLMLLVGTGQNGLAHPNWQENMRLALYLQSSMVNKYPTLARPIALKNERYNQQMTTGSLILEVGSSGNTLSEALQAVRLFAEATAPALLDLVAE